MSTAREKAEALRAALRGGVEVVTAPSLFETPPAVICRMMDAAELEGGHLVLEPSAGTGRLARAAFERTGATVYCVERSYKLAGLLERAGYNTTAGDFLEMSPLDIGGPVDRVVMNPPFERGQDAAHVRHAVSFLKPFGRLVAIVSEGPFFRERRADRDFRDWLADLGGWSEQLPADSFKESGTRVNCRLVVVDS